MLKIIKKKIYIDNSRYILLETGLIANQSDGSVTIRMGNTLLLSTVVLGQEIEDSIDFVPLTIDYREKYFAGGKIPGGFIKREGKPSEEEILTMRIVDRLIRPLIPKNLNREIQIMISLLSYDNKVLPDSLVGLAASTTLLISGIPLKCPVSQIRIAKINNKIIINPHLKDIKKSNINLIIGGTYNNIIMLEGETKEISNKKFINILKYSHNIIKKQIKDQYDFYLKIKKIINIKKKTLKYLKNNLLKKTIKKLSYKKIYYIFKKYKNKKSRNLKFKKNYKKIKNIIFKKKIEVNDYLINKYYNYYKKKIIRKLIFNENLRLDGRKINQIRNFSCKVNYLPGVHGSCLFTRGETQCLTTVTLGTFLDINRIDNVVIENNEKFYIHYNFPPFSTGEVKIIRGISRREIGHGNLAKKSLINMILNNLPYTIRIVSDILESNGSSSMATVCAGTLSLMDSGINLINPVAGVAIGLIKKKNKIKILSDILGEEDHYGDMDFKITRTKKGITSCQMDIKNYNINLLKNNLLNKILNISKISIYKILNIMYNYLPKSRKYIKYTAPKLSLIKIPKKSIGNIIGNNGQIINDIQQITNTDIIINENKKYGNIEIFGNNNKNIKKAIRIINNIIITPKIGFLYKAKIKKINNKSILVEFFKGHKTLLKINDKKIKNKDVNNIKIKFLGLKDN